jgi:tetratricopeptide (TPR) repeat protein
MTAAPRKSRPASWPFTLAFVLVATALRPASAAASDESARLRTRAYQLAYNLDHDAATREMEAAAQADPSDAAAERGLAVIPWLLISFARGAVTVDDYLGSISRPNVAMRQPPPDLAARFHRHAAKALALAEAQLARRPSDPEALYQVGATVALQASYVATVDGKILGAFRAARRAYDAHEQVLELAPARADAGLVVGTYRYIVSAMSLPVRMMAYVAGFGGGKGRGLQLIEQAAASRSEAAPDAKFALVLLYNRERRYDDALRVLGDLQRAYPRNRILWLEAGATALRAGRAVEADKQLATGRRMLAEDVRPRMFGEDALWLQKHGAALLTLDRRGEARAALEGALSLEARKWIHGRAHAELGKLADLQADRRAARVHFQQAVVLAEEDNDAAGASAARRWIGSPYKR